MLPTLALPVALNVVAYTPVAPKLPTLLLPVPLTLPTNKLAPTLPILALPDTDKLVSVPKLVMLGCAAVVRLPVTVVNTPADAPILPTFALPVALIAPVVTKFPPVTLPVAVTIPPVPMFPAFMLPLAITAPPVPRLPTFALPEILNEVPVSFGV